MGTQDGIRWDERYTGRAPIPADTVGPPSSFAPYAELFPTGGQALDVACGQGAGAVWLARSGLRVCGLDVSAVAIGLARDLARRAGLEDRCRFEVADLDDGLPSGPPVDVILCHRFRDRTLYPAMARRLLPGGVLAISVLSEVGAEPGPYRAAAGELTAAFAGLDVIAAGEGAGQAWLLARR